MDPLAHLPVVSPGNGDVAAATTAAAAVTEAGREAGQDGKPAAAGGAPPLGTLAGDAHLRRGRQHCMRRFACSCRSST